MLKKEFRQIFRNKAMIPIIFVAPLIQLIILSNAATFEIRNLKIYFNDFDKSTYAQRLKNAFVQTDYFILVGESTNRDIAERKLELNHADLVCEIPVNFGKDLQKYGHAKLFLKINAIDGTKAGVGINYSQNIIQKFTSDIAQEVILKTNPEIAVELPYAVNIDYSNWYNEKLDYQTYMVPGLLVLLVTLIAAFLSSMNIVREKEMGTIEQINVTPILKYQFIIGKLLPFWILGLVVFSVGLFFAWLIFNIPVAGSLWIIYAFTCIYLLAVLGLGLFISTITDTQQQAMFISWFFFVIFVLMSGLFTAIENMPVWAQKLTLLNPLRYFMEVIRMVLLKGSGFQDVRIHFLIIGGFSILINLFAVWRYRKIT
ncbi:MAG: ABC transporter permease [Cyclobacteriaceae bacterium]|nr:ABC transporter permease [Cyclobacteriaceae bacterium]